MSSAALYSIVCYVLLYTSVFAASQDDEVWVYPQPAENRDVKDISFYTPPVEQGPLANIDGTPRNVILLIGDGMGHNHVALARHRAVGPAGRLYMERLPVAGWLRTYSANRLVTDSAAASTAMACGVKTDNGRIGTTPDGIAWQSILERARQKGYRTGLVATSTITHATPAGFAAHVDTRAMEIDIAVQMLTCGVDVMFGGGRRYWLPEPNGKRADGRSLINEARTAGYQVVYSKDQLAALTPGPVLGLFADDAMTTYDPEPSPAVMTRTAIDLLSANSGEWFAPAPRFFLMIEGSQIDWAAHGNDADNVVRQTLLFDLAIKEAIDFACRDKNTLVVITADHETGGLILQREKDNHVADEWATKGHTAVDVPIYAFGPGSMRFSGTLDNTDIAKRIAEVLGFDHFPQPRTTVQVPEQSGTR